VWYGTEQNGMGCIENFAISDIKYTTENGLLSNSIRCFSENKDILYAGTAGYGISGIPIYNGKGKILGITDKDGLNSQNIYLLIHDDKNQLYSGTESGLDVIEFNEETQSFTVRHYGQAEGFTGIETCLNSVWKDQGGSLWFGTINGLTKMTSSDLHINRKPPVLSILNIRLFYEPICKKLPGIPCNNGIPNKSMELDYSQNHLTFDFNGVNFSNPDAVQYKWKLEGFDQDWSPASSQNTVTYSNLP